MHVHVVAMLSTKDEYKNEQVTTFESVKGSLENPGRYPILFMDMLLDVQQIFPYLT